MAPPVPRPVSQAVKYLTNWQVKGAAKADELVQAVSGTPLLERLAATNQADWQEMREYLDKLKAALGLPPAE